MPRSKKPGATHRYYGAAFTPAELRHIWAAASDLHRGGAAVNASSVARAAGVHRSRAWRGLRCLEAIGYVTIDRRSTILRVPLATV